MTTPFRTIYDIFMTLQTDYLLITLYQQSVPDFENYLQGFLVQGVEDFSYTCDQSLAYTLSTALFTETLTQKNINILAKLVKKYWMKKMIHNISQLENHVVDKDFRMSSEAMNYREKKDGYILEIEEISQILVEYGYRNSLNWDILNAINL